MAQLHPDTSSVIASMLLERPMCLDCISAKTGLSTTEADRFLTVIGTTLQLRRIFGRCRHCGTEEDPVYSLLRSVN